MDRFARAAVTPIRQRTQYSWSEVPLGQLPDYVLAEQLGCRRQTVLAARKRQGIPPYDATRSPKGILWDEVELGLHSDSDLAKVLKVSVPVVWNARHRRGIPPHTPRCAPVDWGNVPFGETTDEALAEILGVSQPTVTRRRNKRGILPFSAVYLTSEKEAAASRAEALIDLYWHENDIQHDFQVKIGPYVADWVVGGDTVVEYAGFAESRMFGEQYKARLETKITFYKLKGWKVQIIYLKDLDAFRPKGLPQVSRDIISGGINWSKQPLGEMLDTHLANRLGVNQSTVTRWRSIFGINPYRPLGRDWSTIPLGQEPDPTIATRLGVSKETVRRARVAHNIPSYRSRHAK